MSEVAETLYVMINKASSEKEQVTTEETTTVEEKEKVATEETTAVEEKENVTTEETTQESKEEAKPVEEDSSEDQTCVDEECKCHDSEEDSKETSEEDGSDDEKPASHVIRVETQFEYFPPSINAFAMLVLFLHFLNALLQLSDRNQNRLECFKRPY